MNWFCKHSFEWQFYWPHWWAFCYDNSLDDGQGPRVTTLVIGPLQMRWWNG